MESTAIVLAAGVGSRLARATDGVPKWLVRVGGAPIADYQLHALRSAEVGRVVVVGGHHYPALLDSVHAHDDAQLIDVIFNPRYRIANNWYSLLLALKTVGPLDREDRLLVVNSDLWGPTACLTGVFNSLLDLGGTRLAVDLNRPLTSESMKVGISSGGFLSCIGKEGVVPAAGEYIGALALDQHGATTLEGCLGECETDRTRWNEWYEHAINRSLQTIAWRVCPVIDSSWVEIDDADDLLQAEKAASR